MRFLLKCDEDDEGELQLSAELDGNLGHLAAAMGNLLGKSMLAESTETRVEFGDLLVVYYLKTTFPNGLPGRGGEEARYA